jgi:hypothetical protein
MDSNLTISLNVAFFQNGDGLSISEIPGLPTPAIFFSRRERTGGKLIELPAHEKCMQLHVQ